MQRTARGLLARLLVQGMQQRRHRAATMLQTLWRQVTARYATFELRNRSYAARTVERAYRGHLGRRRAQNERHKFLFSKSQSQGIEFGTVWKSQISGPTPSTRCGLRSCVCSMAWRLHAIDATW